MTLRDFIKQNRAEIDAVIKACLGASARLNDEERRQWVMNDESLYTWARSHVKGL